MENRDAESLAQQALRLRLITEEQLAECREEVGELNSDPFPLLRVLERKAYLTPWISQKLLKGDLDGYYLGGYRVLYKIASGSFGRVFRADDPRTGTVVAIKVLRRRWSEDPHSIELFEREGKVGMSLRHPNIVEILAVNHDNLNPPQYYIVMEFVEGGNLRDFLAIRKKLQPAEGLRLLEDCTAALAYAYSRGVTHRDMKLTNILISSQGTAKLVDFGLAGLFSSLGINDPKEGGKMDRTVDYAGLEKTTGAPHGDVRSDIYFLGCVLSEMLTGRPPLAMTKDPRARMLKSRFEKVDPIKRSEVEAPPVVFHLVETMMALEPRQRYQTPTQLLEAVREARRDVEAKGTGGRTAPLPRSVFVVEQKERFQNAMREALKKLGYKVLLSTDPARALDRFRQQPFDALVVDVGTTGEDGLLIADQILTEAERKDLPCAAVFLFAREQADWTERVKPRPRSVALVQPVTLKQLNDKIRELVPLTADA